MNQDIINNLTVGQIKSIAGMVNLQTSHPFKIGANYLIRTVTMILAGKLTWVGEHELVLENASWIADTGRFADSLRSCEFNEVEPFPDGDVIVGRGGIIDAVTITSVPREQK